MKKVMKILGITEHENGKLYKSIFTGSAAYPFFAGNLGWKYTPESINISYFMTARTGKTDDMNVADISKEYGGVAPLQSLVQIYDAMSDDVLKVRARSAGSEYEQMLEKTDGYMTAWLLYQLKGDEQAGSAFTGENAEIMIARIIGIFEIFESSIQYRWKLYRAFCYNGNRVGLYDFENTVYLGWKN